MSCQPPVSYANPRDVEELSEPLRSRIKQAIHDSPTGGLVLVSGYRTPYQQWLLRHERCPGRECDPGCKGNPVTALPYKSHHQLRTAADMGGREKQWLIDNREAYGLALTVRTENWHFEANAKDVRTGRVHNHPTVPIGPVTDPNKGRSWLPVRPGDTDQSIFRKGGFDNEVVELQLRLKALANRGWNTDPGKVDGEYGPKSQAAVSNFKKAIIEIQKLSGQKAWKNHDALVGEVTRDMLRWWTA